MLECLDPSIQLPEFNVVTVYKLFGLLDRRSFVLTVEVNATKDVTIRTDDIGAIALHRNGLCRRLQSL